MILNHARHDNIVDKYTLFFFPFLVFDLMTMFQGHVEDVRRQVNEAVQSRHVSLFQRRLLETFYCVLRKTISFLLIDNAASLSLYLSQNDKEKKKREKMIYIWS